MIASSQAHAAKSEAATAARARAAAKAAAAAEAAAEVAAFEAEAEAASMGFRRLPRANLAAFLDDDDEWLTEKMAIQFEAAKTYDDVRLFCSNAFNRTPSGLVGSGHQ
jgi:hypothetical protein